MSARVRKRLAARDAAVARAGEWVRFNGYQVAAALYVVTGGLIDLASACLACKAHGASALCIACGGSGRIPS